MRGRGGGAGERLRMRLPESCHVGPTGTGSVLMTSVPRLTKPKAGWYKGWQYHALYEGRPLQLHLSSAEVVDTFAASSIDREVSSAFRVL